MNAFAALFEMHRPALDAFPKPVAQANALPPEVEQQLAQYKIQYEHEFQEQMERDENKLRYLADITRAIVYILTRIA